MTNGEARMVATLKRLRHTIEMTLQRMADVVGRLTRGMTLGVRALVIGPDGRIFLVKHSYVSGWHLPGGGVEPGETLIDALVRELREEGNLEPTAPPALHGMFFNDSLSPCNHVAVFVVRDFRQLGAPVPDYEIIAHGFFGLDELPNDTTAATRARIIEVIGGAPVRERW
jgi:8-oxo-dGTP pyrophosphatase MutT (NUDIX family)